MSEPTESTLTMISEEVHREVTENATPEIVRQLQDFMGAYATQADLEQLVGRISSEVKATVEASISNKLNEFRQETEQRIISERETTNRQFAGYVQSENFGQLRDIVRDNVAKIASVEAAHDERIKAAEASIRELRDGQTTTVASIETITRNTDTIQQSVTQIQRTHTEMMERDKKRQEEVDRKLSAIETSDAQNVKNIRELQSDVLRQDKDINDQRVRIIEWVTPVNLLVNGDKEAKVPGLHARMSKIEDGLNAALWFISTPAGKRVTGAIIAALVSTNLVTLVASLTSR